MNMELAWIALNLAHKVDRVALHALLDRQTEMTETFGDPPSFSKLVENDGRSPAQLLEAAAFEIEKASVRGISIVTLASPQYPTELRDIYDPPLALYCKGTLPPVGGIAIVGSRSASHYGIGVARSIARDIAQCGIPVISGFARGIDTSAHLGALEAGGVTIAVLGSGFLFPYPRENQFLIPKVAEKGCVLTEFPMDTKPFPMNFPIRNRIISGLGTRGTLVVEAAERSGALITARLASDQGRDVFAIPGNVTSPLSAGTNHLIQDGAKLVRCAADILEEIPGITLPSKAATVEAIDSEEAGVLEKLTADVPVHVDALSSELGILPSRLLVVLLALELKHHVRQLPGKLFLKRL